MTLVLGAEVFQAAALRTFLLCSGFEPQYVAVHDDWSGKWLQGLIDLLQPCLIICSEMIARELADELHQLAVKVIVLRPDEQGAIRSKYKLSKSK
jgi:hypothetical protein